ncbi:unnamed protein product [Mytilus coruscus]|uniref:B box-type domain-containing protein n=1 Tax=Mytilus coruscus TaxID=42192 RepID=A0A6J8DFQ8_MYTCO|nr:unnamed protein product [Mytilus coruscus]
MESRQVKMSQLPNELTVGPKEKTKKADVCDSCKKKKELTSYCDVSKQSYCEICTQKHNTNGATKEHLQASSGGTHVRGEYRATHHKHTPTTVPGDDKGAACTLGMVILLGGRLVVIDNRHKSLKLFNSDRYTYAFRRNFTHEPRGIAAISGKEIAITFADKHVCLKVTKKSLAIEVGEGKYGAIIITNLSGVVLKEISGYTRRFGIFTGNTIRLVHDQGKQLLYIADLTKDCVNCVDYNGTIVWKVRVESPRGIHHHGNTLFIASKSKNEIYQMKTELGADELPILYLLLDSEDGIIEPRFLSYNAQAKRLVVEVAGNLIQTYNCSNRN